MLTAATKAPLRPAPQSPENISTSGLVGEKCREVEEKRRECSVFSFYSFSLASIYRRGKMKLSTHLMSELNCSINEKIKTDQILNS